MEPNVGRGHDLFHCGDVGCGIVIALKRQNLAQLLPTEQRLIGTLDPLGERCFAPEKTTIQLRGNQVVEVALMSETALTAFVYTHHACRLEEIENTSITLIDAGGRCGQPSLAVHVLNQFSEHVLDRFTCNTRGAFTLMKILPESAHQIRIGPKDGDGLRCLAQHGP